MTKFRMLTAALLSATAAATVTAQETPARYAHYTTEHGLPGNQILGVLRDQIGFVWVGTQDGLWRFDGRVFVRYTGGEAGPSALPPGVVTPLLADRGGQLWLLAHREGRRVLRLDPRSGAATTFPRFWGRVLGAYEDTAGGVWYADGAGVWHVRAGHHDAEPVFAIADTAGTEVALFAGAPGGMLWFTIAGARGRRLVRLDPASADTTSFPLPAATASFASGWQGGLVASGDGRIWVGSDHGLGVLDPVSGVFTPYRAFGNVPVLRMTADGPDALWIGTEQWLWRLDTVGDRLARVAYPDALGPPSLRGGIFPDGSGRLWLASLGAGLVHLDPSPNRFTHRGRRGASPLPLGSDFVTALHRDPDGTLWVGTVDAGLHRLSADWELLDAWRHTPDDPDGLPNGIVWGIHRDRAGRLWVGVQGLCLLDEDRGAFDCHLSPASARDITTPAEDGDGQLWIGLYPGGLARFDPSTGQFEVFPHLVGATTLHIDGAGTAWVGVQGGGLWYYDLAARRFRAVENPRQGEVFVIHEDTSGGFWIGTDHGLHRLERDRRTLTSFDQSAGLPPSPVFSIEPDDQGRLWLGTGHGIVRFDPATGAVRRFGRSHGVGGLEFNRGASLRLPNGALLFGGMEGLTEFDPLALDQDEGPAPVLLSHFHTIGRRGARDRMLYGESEVRVGPSDRVFAIEFASPGTIGPPSTRYRYRLDGLDPDWIDVGGVHRVTYSRPAPGRYTFRVQGEVGAGEWEAVAAAMLVVVDPAVWETAWFRLLVLALVAGALLGVHRVRTAHLLRTERLRLRIAHDLHDEIGAELSGIALLSDAVRGETGLDRAARRRLDRISQSARAMVGNLRDIVWTIDPEGDRTDRVLERMRDTAATLLDGVRVTFQAAVADLPPTLDMERRRDLFLIYKEILHNVARHSGATEVAIRLDAADDRLTLVVSDNGRGFDPAAACGGTGLKSVRARVARLGAALDLESAPGRGATIRVAIRPA